MDQCQALETVLPLKILTQLTDREIDEYEESTLRDVNTKGKNQISILERSFERYSYEAEIQ